MAIRSVVANCVYDSRGNPTVEVSIETAHGIFRVIVLLALQLECTKLLNFET